MRSIGKLIAIAFCFGIVSEVSAQTSPRPSWTGFYVGGHLGYGWGLDDSPFNVNVLNVVSQGGNRSIKGPFGGLQVGYNFAIGQFVVGLEIDASLSDIDGNSPIINGANTGNTQARVESFGTGRARIGYLFGNALAFGTGGVALGRVETSRTQLTGTVFNATPGSIDRATYTSSGWVVGGGVEFALAQHWTAKIEYLYVDLGTNTVTRVLAEQRVDHTVTLSTARIGLNYRF